MPEAAPDCASFSDLSTDSKILEAAARLGFDAPTPIQVLTIPTLLEGLDLVGQAQTGTGKTAAFGLPLLVRVDPASRTTQALILAPTRELAIQVARALKDFSAQTHRLKVVPIYGGQDYGTQLRALRKGAQIVVGTPGRIMDHMRRGSLKLDGIKTVVLDEADEMLNMGFVDDIEWILEACPEERQTTLFSATIPPRIRAIAAKYMRSPKHVLIERRTSAATTIRQRHWLVRGLNKLDALSRILEAEPHDGVLIFVRTKASTVTLAEQLVERNLRASALHGDMPQTMREHTVQRIKQGQVDLLVATDVAARGLDIERFSLVVNYDMPNDAEAYVHRIGRTGRAGRVGESISLVAPRERHMLRAIERMTKQTIAPMQLPSAKQLNAGRIQAFKEGVVEMVASGELSPFEDILRELCTELDLDPLEVAAALAVKAQGKVPLLVKDPVIQVRKPGRPRPARTTPEAGMDRYRIEVGEEHGVSPNNIVGAIANTAGLQGRNIGRITINEDHSLVDLPQGMPNRLLKLLQKTMIFQFPMNIHLVSDPAPDFKKKTFRPKKTKDKKFKDKKSKNRKSKDKKPKDKKSKDKKSKGKKSKGKK